MTAILTSDAIVISLRPASDDGLLPKGIGEEVTLPVGGGGMGWSSGSFQGVYIATVYSVILKINWDTLHREII